MIQVIERVAHIMNRLASGEEWSLGKLAESAQFNHATLCNILKSLIAIGWVTKSERGCYRISDYFRELGNAPHWDKTLQNFLQETLDDCAEKIQESVIVFTLHHTKIATMAKATYQHTLMINDERFYAQMSLYTSVSGEVLCAGLKPAQRHKLFQLQPLTENDLQGLGSIEKYEEKLNQIFTNGQNLSVNKRLGIKSWALPIYDANQNICACLGLSVPLTRLPEDEGEHILQELHSTAEKISQWITRKGYLAEHILLC